MYPSRQKSWKDICASATLLLPLLLLTSTAIHGGGTAALNKCLLDGMEQAEEGMTVGELRTACRKKMKAAELADEPTSEEKVGVDSAVVKRYRYERAQQANPFSILPQ